VPDADQAPVAFEIFERYLSGWGYNEIANHLNRPGGPAPPVHVDSARNTARKWSKTTIRAILENPVYTGRLYWNRLDFRAVKQGDGPLVRREREHWIQAERRHEALIPDDWFERVGAEMHRRRTGQASPRRRTPNRFYVLGGIVHCATGHNPLRMQGKTRKGNTYYACGYRISYGDKAAHALGHGKWQYVREDRITNLIDRFFVTQIFGPARVARFKAQHADLARDLDDRDDGQRQHLTSQLTDIDQRLQRQLAAIEAGVDAVLVGDRIRALKTERQQAELAITHLDDDRHRRTGLDVDDACAILDGLPNLHNALAAADPKLRRQVYDAFRLSVEIDRNQAQIRLKALVSSALTEATDLEALVAHKAIAGERYAPMGDSTVRVERTVGWP
jgi:hypothetical protein